MKAKRTTEKALIFSIISTFLCIAMLAGTTFAWFTQNKSQNVTSITIGVDVLSTTGGELGTLKFYTDAECTTEAGNWQPGGTYYMTPFKVANTDELDLVYRITSNLPSENLTWYVDGTAVSDPATLANDVNLASGAEKEVRLSCACKAGCFRRRLFRIIFVF